MRKIKYSAAISEALVQEMGVNPDIFITGIAVDYPSGIFGTTVEAFKQFGPKRVFDSLREPPKIIAQPSESLISLAEKLRYLDVASAGWEEGDSPAVSSTSKTLHQKLKQLPAHTKQEKSQATVAGTTYSLSYSLRNRQRNSGDL